VPFDDLPAEDIRAMQRNTARFALRVSRGLFGASPLLTPILTASVANPEHMPPALVGRYLAPFIGQEGVTHLLALARAVKADDLEAVDLSQVRAHTLIIRGEKDEWVPASVAQKLVTDLPGSRIVNFPEAARLVPEEMPGDLAALIASFVSPHVTRSPDGLESPGSDVGEHASPEGGTPEGGMA